MRDFPQVRRILWLAFLPLLVWCIATAVSPARYGRGDFMCFYDAAVAARNGTNCYDVRSGGYVYPPLLAMLLVPLGMLSPAAAGIIWRLLIVALMAVAAWAARREMSRRTEQNPTLNLAVVLLAILLFFDKILIEIREGQTDLLLMLPFVLALGWLGRRPLACGGALGFAVFIKYLPIIFLPYLIVRGRWREAGAMIVAMGLLTVLPALYFGWEKNWQYMMTSLRGLDRATAAAGAGAGMDVTVSRTATPMATTQVIDWELSVSFPSAISRVFLNHGWPVGNVKYVTVALAGLILAAVWGIYRIRGVPFFAGRRPSVDDQSRMPVVALEWCGVIVAALIFSPQTTARHMLMAFPVITLACTLLLGSRPLRTTWPILVGLLVLALGLVLPPGGKQYLEALTRWRAVAGASWCLLAMYLLLLWTGLGIGVSSSAKQSVTSESRKAVPT
jgi:hypothetical protein